MVAYESDTTFDGQRFRARVEAPSINELVALMAAVGVPVHMPPEGSDEMPISEVAQSFLENV
jgi:hypothetical protein